MEKMFGPVLYEAFRTIKRTLRSRWPLQSRQDRRRAAADREPALRRRLPRRRNPPTFFDYAEHGGLARAVEMCSGLGVCRKTLEGTMCPSYMATREEAALDARPRQRPAPGDGRTPAARPASAIEGVLRRPRSLSRVPRVQGGMPGRRRRRAIQERVPRRLLAAARHAAEGACDRKHPFAVEMGQPPGPVVQRAVAPKRARSMAGRAALLGRSAAAAAGLNRDTFRSRFARESGRRLPERDVASTRESPAQRTRGRRAGRDAVLRHVHQLQPS